MKSDGDVKEGETSMASDQIDRKSKIVNHVNSLEVSINAVKESKECVKEDIEAGKTVLEYLDRAEYEMNKDLNLYKVLNIDRVDELDATIWNNYETQYVKNQNLCASICGYRDNLKQRDPTLSTALSGSFATNASSTSPTAYVLFNNTPVETEQFKSTAAHHKIDKHPVRLIDFIYSELAEIDKDKADLFQKLVREFRAHPALMSSIPD